MYKIIILIVALSGCQNTHLLGYDNANAKSIDVEIRDVINSVYDAIFGHQFASKEENIDIGVDSGWDMPTASFDNKQKRPTLSQPVDILLPDPKYLQSSPAYNACGGGKIYRLTLKRGQDYRIRMKPSAVSLRYPLIIHGGRNVHLFGLSMELEEQAGTGPGTILLSNGKKTIHPTAVTCRALGLEPKSSNYFIEGALIDLKGHNADAMIVNGTIDSSLTVINSRISGVESNHDLHGDVLQTQRGAMRSIIFENVTLEQSAEGIVVSYPVRTFEMRNVNYRPDARYDSDDALDHQVGGFFADYSGGKGGARVRNYAIENVYVTYKNKADRWFIIANKHFSAPKSAGTRVYGLVTEGHPEIHFNKQPAEDFAPLDKVGLNYAKP